MNLSELDLFLAGLGLFMGFITTSSMDLRQRRLLHMCLIPVLLVGLRHLIPGGRDLAVNLAGFTGFLVPVIILAVLLAPSLGWLFSGALLGILDHADHRPIQTLELHQVRRRIASGQRAEAYQLLTDNLRRTRPTYEALYLKAALELDMGKTSRARRTVRRMRRFAIADPQMQFVAQLLRRL